MLNADRSPYFKSCPRCGVGGFETLRTHAFCINCNYAENYQSDEFCVIPQWALEVLKNARPKSVVRQLRSEETNLELENAI